MKKITFLFAVVLITTTSFAQKSFDNEFYFRFGYSNPSWEQFGLTEDDIEGFSKIGFTGEIGTIFMLKGAMTDKVALGINVDYLTVYWHQFSNDNIYMDEETFSLDVATLRVGSKIGPSVTFKPLEKLAFDVYVKADIAWATASAFVYDDEIDDADAYMKIGAVGVSTGVNARIGILMLGFEYNTISPKLENVDIDGDYLGNLNDQNSDKTPFPSISFTVGLSF